MRLTQRTDIALRALMLLAPRGQRRSSVREMARILDVSPHHLHKAVRALVQAGFVDARRGQGGGHRLALEPSAISVGDVVRALEPLEPAECWQGADRCALTPACGLIAVLDQAQRAFLESLDAVPLSRLDDRPMRSQLSRLGLASSLQ